MCYVKMAADKLVQGRLNGEDMRDNKWRKLGIKYLDSAANAAAKDNSRLAHYEKGTSVSDQAIYRRALAIRSGGGTKTGLQGG